MEGSATLYDDDIVAWAEAQAESLRALARQPGLSNALDWENVVEEIEGVGRSQISGVERHVSLVLVHLLKRLSAPDAPPARHWIAEAVAFQLTAARSYTPSMWQRIDIDDLWRDAMREADAFLRAYGDSLTRGLPDRCPFRLGEIASREFDLDVALQTLARSLDTTRGGLTASSSTEPRS